MVKRMAKRKKSKESKSSPTYSVELTGLILILIGIIGMGFGIIGNFIKQFMMFLAGEFWFVILFGVLILGISMLFKRKLPKFFSSRLIGVYILKGAYSIGYRAIQTLLDKSLSQKSLTKILNQI